MDDDWNLHIRQGLGSLRFGLTSAESRIPAEAYGIVTSDRPMAEMDMDDMYRHFAETLGEAEARKAMEILAAADLDTRPRHLQIRKSGVHLTFLDGGLEDIMVEEKATKLHVDGRPFFGPGFLQALQHLQDLNGEPPFVSDVDCYFRAIEVTAFGFIRFTGVSFEMLFDGTAGGKEDSGFSIGWRNTPRNKDEDLSGHDRFDLKTLAYAIVP